MSIVANGSHCAGNVSMCLRCREGILAGTNQAFKQHPKVGMLAIRAELTRLSNLPQLQRSTMDMKIGPVTLMRGFARSSGVLTQWEADQGSGLEHRKS